MKKTLILLLLILILFSGCSKENDLEQPVNLYYLKSDYAFGDYYLKYKSHNLFKSSSMRLIEFLK